MIASKWVWIMPIGFGAMVFVVGCKENGCTDPLALNYNSVAKKDDGSCLYCEIIYSDTGQISLPIVDDNIGGQHYNETVARVRLTQKIKMYNFTTCGDDDCVIYYEVENLISQRIRFSYRLINESGSSLTSSDFVDVAAFQVSNKDSISFSSSSFFTTCAPVSSSGISTLLSSTITYN